MADPEAASPVLAPEGGPPPWYQALQPEELRWLQAPEEGTAPEASLEEPCSEPGQGQSPSQPLRYKGTPGAPTQTDGKASRDGRLPLRPDPFSPTSSSEDWAGIWGPGGGTVWERNRNGRDEG